MSEYLEKVIIYLKQELPAKYRDRITLAGNKIEVEVPGNEIFSNEYDVLYKEINTSINRVRARKIDLAFNIKSKFQERDFKIFKIA